MRDRFLLLICLSALFLFAPVVIRAQGSYYEQGKAAADNHRKVEYFTKALETERKDSWVYYFRGWAYYGISKYDKALRDFQSAETAEGNLPKTFIYSGMGWTYYRLEKYKEGLEAANKALADQDDNSEAYSVRGWCLIMQNDPAGAVTAFDKYITLEPKSAIGYSNRAYAHTLTGEYDKVLQDCDLALAISPDDEYIVERKAVALLKLNRNQEGIALIREKINYKPDDPRSLSNIGDVFYRNEDYKTAIEYHTQAMRLYDKKCKEDREYIRIFRDDIYNIYLARGHAYYAMVDYQRALGDYKFATTLKPDDYRAWHEIGELQTFQKNWTEGATAYEKAFALKPDLQYGWVNLGFCYDNLSQPYRAIDAYTRGIKNNPDVGLLYNNRGYGYLELKQYDLALADLEKAIEVEPMIVMSHVSLGEYYYDRKQYGDAIAKFDKALKMEDGTTQAYTAAYYTRGMCYFDQADYEKAKADFLETLKLTPTHVLAYEKLGISYYKLGALCDSYKALRKALDLENNVAVKQAKEAPKYMGKMTSNPCNK